jgi:hypothetical protein
MSITTMGAKTQAFDFLPTPFISHYPLPLSLVDTMHMLLVVCCKNSRRPFTCTTSLLNNKEILPPPHPPHHFNTYTVGASQNGQGRKGPCIFQRLNALKCLKCQKIQQNI